jgi:hypothetical protein
VDVATACVVTRGKHFQKIQITVCHTIKPAPTVISSLKFFCRIHLVLVKYDLTSLPTEFGEDFGLKAEK